jgi:hypothetical protein
VKPFHDRLARVGLAAISQYGFVLAGGYALSANGIGNRPSADVDLFTRELSVESFSQAVDSLLAAVESDGLTVAILTRGELFLDVSVSDPSTHDQSDLQLGYDTRQFPPRQLAVGPVQDLRDAAAGKMSALYSRALPVTSWILTPPSCREHSRGTKSSPWATPKNTCPWTGTSWPDKCDQ